MSYQVKIYSNDAFYETFCEWLNTHRMPVIKKTLLPRKVFVCYNSKEEACYASWFYETDSNLAWIGYTVSNKKVKYENKKESLKHLIKHIVTYSKELGFEMLFTTSSEESIMKTLNENQFSKGDINVTHFFKNL